MKAAASGAASLLAITGFTLSNPQGVAVDGNGNVYIADSGHRRVIEVAAAGTASVVQTPGQTIGTIMYGVTADANGNIYVVDWSNNRVMKVDVSGAALSFANTVIGATSSDSPKTTTVTNAGNEALVFSANPSYTANFSENTGDLNLCATSTSVDPGGTCDVSVMFTPQLAGSLSTNIVLTDNHLNGSNATQNVAVSGTGVSPTTPTITWLQPSPITYGTTLSGILNAVAMDGSTTVPGTYAYTATPQGGTAFTVTTSTVLGAGDYTLSVTFTPTDTINYTTATGSVPLVVNKATPSIALASSPNPAFLSTSITFTATVSSTVSVPTGTADFSDGTTLLGSGTLASGTVTYTTSTLTAGTHSVTAVYSGDSNFSSVTSSPVSQVMSDLTLNVGTGGSASATVSPGGTATYSLTLSPSAGTVFPAAVNLSSSGGPAGSTFTITPQTISAGDGTTNVRLAVHVPAGSAAIRSSNRWMYAFAIPLIGLLVLPFGIERGRLSLKQGLFPVLLLLILVGTGIVLGCGGGSSPQPAQSTNYTITLTATSGSLSRSMPLTLTVR